MHEPKMQSPLHTFALPALAKPIDGSAGAWGNEVPLLGYISLRGNAGDGTFTDALSGVLGVDLPVKACMFVQSAGLKVLWLSPDEWLIVCPRKDRDGLLAKLSTALKGIKSQVVDNAGGFTQILLKGPHAADVLSHMSVYDIHALGDGRVVGTTFGKSSIYLHREADGFALLLRRSFADYIWRCLVRAAAPYGFGVARLDGAAAGEAK